MKKSKLGLPPAAPISTAMSNSAMQAMINKGGSVSEDAVSLEKELEPVENKLKYFTFKIYESELAQIRAVQDTRPKRDRISIHDFVLAAVKEKIKKETK